jgi:hypothetical protein
MVTTHQTMDDHSLEIKRDGKFIGHVLWHKERPPLISLHTDVPIVNLTFAEIETIKDNYEAARKLRGN